MRDISSTGGHMPAHKTPMGVDDASSTMDELGPTTARRGRTAKITVVARKRPLLSPEIKAGSSDVIMLDPSDNRRLLVTESRKDLTGMLHDWTFPFLFDRVYGASHPTQVVYEDCVRPLVERFLANGGKNSIFTYGQTGSGKSYSMLGCPTLFKSSTVTLSNDSLNGISSYPPPPKHPVDRADWGFLQFAVERMFEEIEAPSVIRLTCYEIYSNKVYDLLNDRTVIRPLETRGGGVQVHGLSFAYCADVPTVLELVTTALRSRVTGQNAKNKTSSRGHMVATVEVVDHPPEDNDCQSRSCALTTPEGPPKLTRRVLAASEQAQDKGHPVSRHGGKIAFIDLAGTERGSDTQDRTNKWGSSSAMSSDGAGINQSLLALKECFRAIDSDSSHVPFRNSQLTKVLREFLVPKNACSLMMAHLSPASRGIESAINALQYTAMVMELRRNCEPLLACPPPRPSDVEIYSITSLPIHSNKRTGPSLGRTIPLNRKDLHTQSSKPIPSTSTTGHNPAKPSHAGIPPRRLNKHLATSPEFLGSRSGDKSSSHLNRQLGRHSDSNIGQTRPTWNASKSAKSRLSQSMGSPDLDHFLPSPMADNIQSHPVSPNGSGEIPETSKTLSGDTNELSKGYGGLAPPTPRVPSTGPPVSSSHSKSSRVHLSPPTRGARARTPSGPSDPPIQILWPQTKTPPYSQPPEMIINMKCNHLPTLAEIQDTIDEFSVGSSHFLEQKRQVHEHLCDILPRALKSRDTKDRTQLQAVMGLEARIFRRLVDSLDEISTATLPDHQPIIHPHVYPECSNATCDFATASSSLSASSRGEEPIGENDPTTRPEAPWPTSDGQPSQVTSSGPFLHENSFLDAPSNNDHASLLATHLPIDIAPSHRLSSESLMDEADIAARRGDQPVESTSNQRRSRFTSIQAIQSKFYSGKTSPVDGGDGIDGSGSGHLIAASPATPFALMMGDVSVGDDSEPPECLDRIMKTLSNPISTSSTTTSASHGHLDSVRPHGSRRVSETDMHDGEPARIIFDQAADDKGVRRVKRGRQT